MLPEQFVYLAVLLSIAATISYLKATIQGTTKPNRVTWFFWSLAPLIAFAAQIDEGVGVQSLLTLSVGLGPLLILIASFLNKKSIWKISRFDIFCGIFASIALALWYLSKDGTIAIAFSILADSMAAIPTIVKTYKAPATEDERAYILTGLSALITLLTIQSWVFSNYAFPMYVLMLNVIVLLLIRRKSIHRLFR